MRKVILFGENIQTTDQFHTILKHELDFPDYYGGNLDALWDCLTGWVELPLEIEWIDFEVSKNALGDYINKVVQLFEYAKDELDGFGFSLK